VTIMGTVLSNSVATYIADGLAGYTPSSQSEIAALKGLASGDVPSVSALPRALRSIVEASYGHGIADAFLVAAPLAVIGIIAIAFIKNKPLSTKNSAEQLREQAEESAIEIVDAEVGAANVLSDQAAAVGLDASTANSSVALLDDQESRR